MKKKNTKFYIIGAALVVALLIGFGGNSNRELASSQFGGDSGDSQTNESLAQNAPVGDFTLEKLDGSELTLSDYKGEKPVILDFWASWCPNCKRNMPRLSSFYDKYKNEIEIIGINLQEPKTTARRFTEGIGVSFPIVLDPAGVAARLFGVSYTNYHVLINKNGTLAGVIPGDIAEEHIVALIDGQPTEIEVTGGGNLEVEIVQ